MIANYPNIELLEYKAKQGLVKDKEFTDKVNEKRKINKYRGLEFEAIVFPQMWGSTSTGFDVMEDGSAAIGGCAMTKEYTTIIHELLTDTYVVCFGDRPCYSVTDANEKFLTDLNKHNMASLSEAKRKY